MSKKGFVYVLLNPSFTKELKIGKTQNTSEARAKEIYRQAKTGIPTEFVVAYESEVSNCDLVELLVHKELQAYRVNQDREFFRVPLKLAVKTIEKVINDLEKQHKLDYVEKEVEKFTPKKWWDNLSFVWQQIFRSHLDFIKYQPNEMDLFRAIHSIIDHCQEDKLRAKVSELITDKMFTQNLTKWYSKLDDEKTLFNSYLPHELSEQEIQQVLKLTKINCSNHFAVIDFKPLEKLPELKFINGINTNVSDLSSLKYLYNLEEIHLNYTKIDSLEALENLPNLKKITCYGTDLKEIEIERFSDIQINCEVLADIFLTAKQPVKRVKK